MSFLKRVKRETTPLLDDKGLDEQMAIYAKCENELTVIVAELESKTQAIRESYTDKIDELRGERDEAMKLIHFWAEKHKEERFSKKKSQELLHGRIGFRTGTPKLKTIKGFTWASVTQLLKEFYPDFIRSKEEVDKEKLIAFREEEEAEDIYAKVGVELAQDEVFFIEPKTERVE